MLYQMNLDYPLRQELHDELHARPSLYFVDDTDVWHVALIQSERNFIIPNVLLDLESAKITRNGKHGIASFFNGQIKWEIHTEFISLTYVVVPDISAIGVDEFLFLCSRIGGQAITRTKVITRKHFTHGLIANLNDSFVASSVAGDDAEVHSNFKLNDQGFVEMYLFNKNLNAYRMGRMVRRLLEIDTYRMMSLLSVPVARETTQLLEKFDDQLNLIIDHMREYSKVDKSLLVDITKLSSDVIKYSAKAKNRFSATKAYSDLVETRLLELREGRVVQRQRLGTFIQRRFRPAIRSVEATERRLDELAARVSLVGALLRTTIQVQLEDQNASLLTSMEERARIQVKIQQAVEGFSIIAISYYAMGIFKLFLESIQENGVDVHFIKASMIYLAPILILMVWLTVKRVKKSVVSG